MAFLVLLAVALQGAPIKVTTLTRSTMSQVVSARQAVARTPAEWTALWKEHSASAPAPKVDLSKDTVVAVFLGQRMTGGYTVEITEARLDGGTLVVRWSERKPAADQITAQVLTSPAHIASIPAFAGQIRFERVDK